MRAKVGVAIGHYGLALAVSALGVDEEVKGLVRDELVQVGLQHVEIYYILRNRGGRKKCIKDYWKLDFRRYEETIGFKMHKH